MASKPKAQGQPPSTGADVLGLLDNLRRSKNFKQLATYAIQCLEKVIAPPRVGWEVFAKQAVDRNAADDIAEIAQRFAADAEIFLLAVRSLSALASVPKGLTNMTSGGSIKAVILAVRDHFRSVEFSINSGEEVGRLLGSFNLLQLLLRSDTGAFVAAGGLALLLEVACMAQAGAGKGGKSLPGAAFGVVSPLVTSASQALDRLSRTKPGLDALVGDRGCLASLVRLAATNLNVAEIRSNDLRKSFRRAASMARLAGRLSTPSKGSASAGSGGGNPSSPRAPVASLLASPGMSAAVAAGRDNNGHLEPAFRVLDRCVRSDAGRDAALSVDATTILPGILEQVQGGRAGASAGKALETLIMRVLARLLGSDITHLVGRLGGDDPTTSLSERVLCARLLAGLMGDPDNREAVLAGEGALARRLVVMLTAPETAASDAVAPILQALAAVARASPDASVILYDSGALHALADTLLSRLDEPAVAAEAAALLAALIDCTEMVSAQAETSVDAGSSRLVAPGTHSLPSLVARALELNAGSDTAALSCLQYTEAVLLHDDEHGCGAAALNSSSPTASSHLTARVLRCMAALPDSLPVQALATDVLNYLATTEEAMEAMVAAGVIPRLISNLTERDKAGSGGGGVGGGLDSPVKGAASGLSSRAAFMIASPGGGGADEEDDLATAAAAMGGDTRVTAALSLALVFSTLHFIPSLCALPAALALAKDSGIIHAVLAGFSTHSSDPSVYKLFREVVSALSIEEEEVQAALEEVDVAASGLQSLAASADPEAFRYVTEYCAAKELPSVPAARGSTQAALSEALLENISLLEAVTVSPVFVAIIVAGGGLPILVRVVAVMAAARTQEGRRVSGVAGLGRGGGKDDSALPLTSVADQVLSRACNTLAHVSRVAYELSGGSVEHDPAYEPVDYAAIAIPEAVYDKEGLAALCRAMLTAAKPTYKAFAKDAITLVSWLASGKSHGDVRQHVDALVAAQCIEASVALLRAHQNALDVCASLAGALARISVSPKGAAAVAQRGASRQIIRMLRSTAALRTPQGDALLLSFLRLLDTCARGGAEAADLLRKQGTVDALVECLDAGTAFDFFASDEDSAAAAKASLSSLGGSTAGGGLDVDPAVRRDITTAVTSLLSKLVGPELVRETAAKLSELGSTLQEQAPASYTSRKTLRLQAYERTCVMRPLVLLGMLAETADAGMAGAEVLEVGAMGAIRIAAVGLTVTKAFAAEGGAPHSKSVEEEVAASLPAALRTIRQVLGPMVIKASQGKKARKTGAAPAVKALVSAVPVAVRALEERPDCSAAALGCLASLCGDEYAAAVVPGALEGRGIGVVMDALRAAGDGGEDDRMRDALWTLVGVAALPDCRPLVIVAGAATLASALLSDMVNDSGPECVAACITLLAHCAVEAKVAADLLTGLVMDSLRTASTRYCTESGAPSPDVLRAVAALLAKLVVTRDVAGNTAGRGEEARNLLKRVVKALSASSACLNDPRCSEAVLDCVAAACTAAGVLTSACADAAQAAVTEADGEKCIIMAMSSSAADDAVLAAGARALASIGASSTAAKTLAEIDEYAGRIPEWLEAGHDADSPDVIDLVAGMGDLMRSLGSNIVGSASSSADLAYLPDLGDSYREVLMTIWRAMHVVCKSEMTQVKVASGAGAQTGTVCGKSLRAARADVMALGAQITGRLTQVGAFAVQIEGVDGAHAVSGEDAINVLATVFYAAQEVVELRLVEAACRALNTCLTQYGGEAVAQCSSTGIISSLNILAELVEEAINARKAEEAAGGLGEQDDSATIHAPLDELLRMLSLVEGTLVALTRKARVALETAETATCLLEPSVAADVLDAAAHASTEDAGGADEAGGEDAGSDLQSTVAAYVRAAGVGGNATLAVPFGIVATVASKVMEECAGAGRHAPHGLAPSTSVHAIHGNVRLLATLAPAIRDIAGNVPKGATTASFLTALLDAVSAVVLVASPSGAKWRKLAAAALAGSRPDKGDHELEAPPGVAPRTDKGKGPVDSTVAKQHWAAIGTLGASALPALFDTIATLPCGSGLPGGTAHLSKPPSVAALALTLQGNPPSSSTVALSAIRALAHLSDVGGAASDSKSGGAPGGRVDRLSGLGTAGAYRAVFAGLTSPGNDGREEYAQEAVSLVATLLRVPGVDVTTLGLGKGAILALQAALRSFPGNKVLAAGGSVLLAALQAVFTEQSGTAFEGSGKRAIAAMSDLVKSSFCRHMTKEGQMYYALVSGEDSSWESPDIVNNAMMELVGVDRMTRQLEDEAVTAVAPTVVEGLLTSMTAHAHDPGVVGILAAALAKLAANPDNHAALLGKGVVPALAKIMEEEGHESDPRCAEAFVSLVLPLSFDQDAVRGALGPAGVAPIVLRIAERFSAHLTTHAGAPMSWVPENVADYDKQLAAVEEEAAKGPEREERTKRAPRLAQSAAQTIANLACDNSAAEGELSTVDVLMQHGAVEKLAALMHAHPDNPRLLEDAICGLSNLAFVSDAIQTHIGRTCMDAVCATARRFNSDAYVFEMTLRAIGNLTRVDENILRAVGYGVIRGMVEGMRKHGDSPSTLKLCGDVMGNMVSIDPRRQNAQEAVVVLRETLAAAAGLGLESAGPPLAHQPVVAAGYSSDEEILSRLERGEVDVKEAVCSLLYKDGGAEALVETMTAHPGKGDLAASCLRALNYCVGCPALSSILVPGLDLPSKVVLVCTANDTSPDVIKRTCRILAGMAGSEKLAASVALAGAPSALLAVLDTHKSSRDLCYLACSVLAMLKGPALTTAVRELRALDSLASLFKAGLSDGDVEVYALQLELINSLASEGALAGGIATKVGPALLQLLQSLTDARTPLGNDGDALVLLSSTLSTLACVVRHGVAGSAPLLDAGLCRHLTSLMELVLGAGAGDPSILLAKEARRAALSAVQILGEVVRPPVSLEEGGASLIILEAAQTVNAEGCAPVLERLLAAYKAIPDPSNPGTLLYDAATTKAAVGVLTDLCTVGHTLAPDTTLDLDFLAVGQAVQQPKAGGKAGAPASSGPAPGAGPRKVGDPDVSALLDRGAAVEVWAEGKSRKARVYVSPDLGFLTVAYKDKEGGEYLVDVKTVRRVTLGAPSGAKKKTFFGKSARPERSVCVEGDGGYVLLHAEVEEKADKDRAMIANAVAVLARVGVENRG